MDNTLQHTGINEETSLELCSSPPESSARRTLSCCSSEVGTESPSDIDSLDSDVVRAAMESLDIEEDDYETLFDIAILDYETGRTHEAKVFGINNYQE